MHQTRWSRCSLASSRARSLSRFTWVGLLALGCVSGEGFAQLATGAAAKLTSTPARWVPTGSLNIARTAHTATRLLDGRVLVAGGIAQSQTLDSAELYDPITGTWRLTGKLSQVREGHTATLLMDGRVLVAGGCDVYDERDSYCATAEVFDPATGAWSLTGRMANVQYQATATRLQSGQVLVASRRDVSLYDPVNGVWKSVASVPGPHNSFAATLLPSGQVLTTGGFISSGPDTGPVATTQLYDPLANVWNRVGNLNVAKWRPTLVTLGNGSVVAVGEGLPPTPTELFDQSTGTWTSVGRLNIERGTTTATLLSTGEVLVAAGWNGDPWASIRDAEVYDPLAKVWRVTASLNVARFGHTATLLPDGRVLVAGGDGPRQWEGLASSEVYEPGALPPIAISAGFTGSWFDPAQSGHGLELQVLPGEPMRLLASWFTFAPHGGQTWITGVGAIDGKQAVVQAYQMSGEGGRFPPNFDAANVYQQTWGTLTFAFSDCDHGHVDWTSYAPGYGSGGMDLTRLTLPAGLTCAQ